MKVCSLVTLNQQVRFYTTMLLDNRWTVMVEVSSFPSHPLLDSKTHDWDVHALCVYARNVHWPYLDLMGAFKGVAIPMKISQ